MKTYGEWRYSSAILTSALVGGECSHLYAHAGLINEETFPVHTETEAELYTGWVWVLRIIEENLLLLSGIEFRPSARSHYV
jgi:hypothetical protein